MPKERAPTALDWTPKMGSSLAVRDQGMCGSCWAIAAAMTIQLQAAVLMNVSTVVSGQDIICSTPNPQHCGGTGKCEGATPELAYAWAAQHGVRGLHQLQYVAGSSGEACAAALAQEDPVTPALKIGGYHRIHRNNRADEVRLVLATVGPVA